MLCITFVIFYSFRITNTLYVASHLSGDVSFAFDAIEVLNHIM